MEEKCRKCGAVLFKKVNVDGHWQIDSSTPLSLESENGKHFYRCSTCKAKNIVIADTTGDLGKLRITRTED
jgi:hypothetical protein